MFIKYLERLNLILEKAKHYAIEKGMDESVLINAKLTQDMFPLSMQISIGTDFAMRAIKPLLHKKIIIKDMPFDSMEQMQLRIKDRLSILKAISRNDVLEGRYLKIQEKAGDATFESEARVFITQYAMPNFFFHICMAYAILRSLGCPIGKEDFDGFHSYAAS